MPLELSAEVRNYDPESGSFIRTAIASTAHSQDKWARCTPLHVKTDSAERAIQSAWKTHKAVELHNMTPHLLTSCTSLITPSPTTRQDRSHQPLSSFGHPLS